jgi:hydroxymethylbilane synthase
MIEQIVIGTRGSALALVQAHWVRDELVRRCPDLTVVVSIIQTAGDKSQEANTPLASFSDKGIFAKEIESALLAGAIDLAVHSMKDLATTLPNGLQIGAVPQRVDMSDALLGKSLSNLAPGERIGTGSVRRSALLRHLRSDLNIVDVRGNVDTRIRKLKEGQYDAIVLAVAGLTRLGRTSEIAEKLDPATFVPDPGQGALAIQTRVGDDRVNSLIASLNHEPSFAAITAERSFLAEYGGGCQTPVGAWARMENGVFKMTAMAAIGNEGPRFITVDGISDNPAALGITAATALKK